MKKFEKIQLFLGFSILFGYPFIFLIIGGQMLFAGFSLLGVFLFFGYLQITTCNHCVNFSCPLNRVPKQVVDAYLEKNPGMKEAWLNSGYKIESKDD